MLAKLRHKVAEHLHQHLYDSAVFWADKLVTMSGNDAEDVYRLAQAYYLAGLHQRAMHAVQQAGLLQQHDKFRYLVAKCHVVREEWELVGRKKGALLHVYMLMCEQYLVLQFRL